MQKDKNKQILKFVLPTILSQCAFFVFTIVDGIFVGNGVGSDALGAVNLALPFTMILGALFMFTTMGGITLTAIYLGKDEKEKANKVFMHSLVATLAISIVFAIVGILFTNKIVALLGAKDNYIKMCSDYVFWYSVFTIPSGLFMALQGFGRNDNAPVLVSASVILTTALNIFLDWLFVFPLQMGIRGAAIATGISQTTGFIILTIYFLMKKGALHFGKFKIDRKLIKEMAIQGLPEMTSEFATPITIICMNHILFAYLGGNAVNAYSVISYIASFAYAVFLGNAQGFQPLFGQTYGKSDSKSLKYYLKSGITIGLIGSILVYILVILFGKQVSILFGADKETLGTVLYAIPKYTWAFIPISFNVLVSSYLYSIKKAKESTIINFVRGFIVLPIVLLFLPRLLGKSIIWFTVGIAEITVCVFTIFILKRKEKNN